MKQNDEDITRVQNKVALKMLQIAVEEKDVMRIVDAMGEGNSSAEVARDGCNALLSLTFNDDNQKIIGETGGIAMIISVTEAQVTSSAAEYGCASLTRRQQLRQQGKDSHRQRP